MECHTAFTKKDRKDFQNMIFSKRPRQTLITEKVQEVLAEVFRLRHTNPSRYLPNPKALQHVWRCGRPRRNQCSLPQQYFLKKAPSLLSHFTKRRQTCSFFNLPVEPRSLLHQTEGLFESLLIKAL